jgi:hypothetical protein
LAVITTTAGALLSGALPAGAVSTHPNDVIVATGSDTTERLMDSILTDNNSSTGTEFNIHAQQNPAKDVPDDTHCAGSNSGKMTFNGSSRMLQDGVLTAGSNHITSATANFVAGDVGHFIAATGIAASQTITAVNSTTDATFSGATPTANASNLQLVVYGFGSTGGTTISPNGSGAGRDALKASAGGTFVGGSGSGCVDIARSSGEPRALTGSGSDNTTFEYYAFALDEIDIMSPSLNAPAALTLAQVQGIFNCSIRDWSELPGGGSGNIQRLFPQSGSGTGSTTIAKLLGGASPFSVSDPTGASDPLHTNRPCNPVVAVEENHGNDPNVVSNYANGILPYSSGKWQFQSSNVNNFTLDIRNGLRPIGFYNDGAGGTAATYPLVWTGSAFGLNGNVVTEANVAVTGTNYPGVRYLYNVVDSNEPSYQVATEKIVGYDGTGIAPLCSGAKLSLIRSNGFLNLPAATEPVSAALGGGSVTSTCRLNPVAPPPIPVVTLHSGQSATQAYGGGPVTLHFDVNFSDGASHPMNVTGLTNSDFTVAGTLTPASLISGATVSITSGSGASYAVDVTVPAGSATNLGTGNVKLTLGSGKAFNVFGTGNASSSTIPPGEATITLT